MQPLSPLVPSALAPSISRARRASAPAAALLGAATLLATTVGCGGNVAVPGGSPVAAPPDPGYVLLTGNWQFQATPSTGVSPFASFSGFVYEEADDPGTNDVITSAFQVVPSSGCYVAAVSVPLKGTAESLKIAERSFSVNGQFLSLTATRADKTSGMLSGTYSVAGGCANGATGTITGVKYAPLTGSYTGSIDGTSPAKTIALKLSQFTQGTGDGIFLISGSATLGGFACFTGGTLASADGAITGSSAILNFTANDGQKTPLQLAGTFDPAAKTLTLSSINVPSGSCSGSYGTATLAVQP